jgi:hypothetical protein
MKYTFARTSLLVILALAVTVAFTVPAHAGDHDCTLARAAGKWSLTDNGTVIGIGPRTAVGVFKLEANGSLTNGTAASSLNGVVASETFSGTFTVNPDCSGSFDVKIYSGSTELFELTAFTAFDKDMTHMRAVFTSITTPSGASLASVINLDANRQ